MSKKTIFYFLLFLSIQVVGQEVVNYSELDEHYKTESKNTNSLKSYNEIITERYVSLPFYDDFSYNSIYPNQTKWADKYVFVNNTFGKNSPNIGVATFDALNSNGKLYATANSNSFSADTLTSKPINLFDKSLKYKSNNLYIKVSDTEYKNIRDTSYFTDRYTNKTVKSKDGYWYYYNTPIFYDEDLTDAITDALYFSEDQLNFTMINRGDIDPISYYSEEDSIVLSFFYQAGGFGDMPEEKDSLVIEYYTPGNRDGLVINEVSRNKVEIYNSSPTPKYISGHYLVFDTLQKIIDSNILDSFLLTSSSIIEPYGHTVVETVMLDSVDFILLISPSKEVIDSFAIVSDITSMSNARVPDASDNIVPILDNSFGKMNDGWKRFPRVYLYPTEEFRYISIPLFQTEYFSKAFRFRFRNYASISNDPSHARSEDHWNIDVVWIDANRVAEKEFPKDAFIKKTDLSNTFLSSSFRSIPYTHIEKLESNFTKSEIYTDLINGDNKVKRLNFGMKIKNIYPTNSNMKTISFEVMDLGDNAILTYRQSIESFNLKTEILNYIDDSDSASFEIKFYYDDLSNSEKVYDDFRWNDTVTIMHHFHNYYAYDDGTAEAGYGLRGVRNAKLAYRYETLIPDTLQGVAMYFNPTTYDFQESKIFSLCIWEDNNGEPGNLIYEQPGLETRFHNKQNAFVRYEIDPEYILDNTKSNLFLSGSFFIGWNQPYDVNLNLGLDLNTNSLTRIYHNIGSGWQTSAIERGSLMLRPLFGEKLPPDTKIIKTETFACEIFPIPAKNRIFVKSDSNISNIKIVNILGKELISTTDTEIEISEIKEGFYFILITNSDKQIYSKKIQIIK